MQKDTVTAFHNVLRRIYAKENKEKYHLICTKTSNQDEERIWELCKAFWHPEYLCRTSDIEKYEPNPSLDDATASFFYTQLCA